jgi:hypothetical protein
MTPVVHLVYPHGPGIAAPDVIGRRLGEHLERGHEVRRYDWDGSTAIHPAPGDVLIGHPHPVPGTTFRRSFRRQKWSRRFVLSPFNGDPRQVAFLDPFVRRADAYLAITGAWWFDTVAATPMAHWRPRMIHLDLALERSDFPRVKGEFAPPGLRRFLYIGHSGWQKNVGYLSEIARARPQWDFAWMGRGAPEDVPGVLVLGPRDTSSDETRELVASYDFMITVGRSDANPMSVLEAMGWGLLPVCTPQSGYVGEVGVTNVPVDDIDGALHVLDGLQFAPDGQLEAARLANDGRLAQHYTWQRFGDQVAAALEAAPLPPLGQTDRARRIRLAATAALSPSGPLRGPGTLPILRDVARGLRRYSYPARG